MRGLAKKHIDITYRYRNSVVITRGKGVWSLDGRGQRGGKWGHMSEGQQQKNNKIKVKSIF